MFNLGFAHFKTPLDFMIYEASVFWILGWLLHVTRVVRLLTATYYQIVLAKDGIRYTYIEKVGATVSSTPWTVRHVTEWSVVSSTLSPDCCCIFLLSLLNRCQIPHVRYMASRDAAYPLAGVPVGHTRKDYPSSDEKMDTIL